MDNPGDLLERDALESFRKAMRSRDSARFRANIRDAIEKYERTSAAASPGDRGRLFRRQAMLAYLRYWIASSVRGKQDRLDETWSLTKRALNYFERAGNGLEFAKTYTQLSLCIIALTQYKLNARDKASKMREVVDLGRHAIRLLSTTSGNRELLTGVLVRTAFFLDIFADYIVDVGHQKECDQEAIGYWRKALRLGRQAALIEIASQSPGFFRILGAEEGVAFGHDALSIARKTGDNFALGWLLTDMAHRMYWKAKSAEPESRRVEIARGSLRFAEEAAERYDRIGYTAPDEGVLWVHSPYAEHFLELSRFEKDPERRVRLLEKSVSSTEDLLSTAQRTSYPEVVIYAHHVASKCKAELAENLEDGRRKRRLLLEALAHRRKELGIVRKALPPDHWNQGVLLRRLGAILVDLADLEVDRKKKESMVREAVRDTEEGLEISTMAVQALDRSESHFSRAPLAQHYRDYGDLLVRMHSIKRSAKSLRKAANAFLSASSWYENTGLSVSQAACYWRAAKTYERLQTYSFASENYALASKKYRASSLKQAPMRAFYQDLSLYLSGCSRIATAKQHHSQLEFEKANRLYRQAANALRKTHRWNFLAAHFSAWAKFESAENLSRSGSGFEAIGLFKQASELFGESNKLLRYRLEFLQDPEEKSVTNRLVNAPTQEYCHARIMLEEARIAESRGDYATSSEKFRLASDKLREVSSLSTSDTEAKEADFLFTLARAWQLSSRAELDQSDPALRVALSIFERARQSSPDEKAAILASAHVDFCKGLLAARLFGETLDLKFNIQATERLTSAASRYLDSGFVAASEHATGRKLTLEAFAEINRGNRSTGPGEKAEHYGSAELLLRNAAEAFGRAQQPARLSQVLKILDMTRAEWQLASQMAEIGRVASDPSTNLAIHAFNQNIEQTFGPEKFEHPSIEARLVLVAKNLQAPDLEFSLEILNFGEDPIQLLRIDNILPEASRLVMPVRNLTSEGSSLVLNGNQIPPQSRETLRFSLRLQKTGLLLISPRMSYLNGKGLQEWHRLQPLIVATSPIVEFLTSAFAKDYSNKRLAPIYCGWRSLMETSAALKIPRSHLYGEPRYGRLFGRQLRGLVDAGLVESRAFPGERGRGGVITKIRVSYENETVRRYVDELTLGADHQPIQEQLKTRMEA